MNPSQSMRDQFDVLLAKSHRLALAISGSSVNPREAFLAYFSVYQPAVSYVLPLTHFTPKQCHRLQVLPTQLFLSKCGFPSTMHRAIVFASRASGGLGFRHPRIEQGISQIIKFIQTLRTANLPAQLLKLTIHEWQIHSGVSFSLLECPTRSCPHLEGPWLCSLRQFLASISASIITSIPLPVVPRRTNDRHLMDLFNSMLSLGPQRMKRLNYCRLYLQITLTSEIVTADGSALIPHFWGGSGPRPEPPLLKYPRQGCPDSSVWKEWRAAIRKVLCFPRSLVLRRPLGSWFMSPPRYPKVSIRPLRLWLNPHSYTNIQQQYPSYLQFSTFSHCGTIPSTSIPVDFLDTHNRYCTTLPHEYSPPHHPVPPHPLLGSLPPWKCSLLENFHLSVPLSQIVLLLTNPTRISLCLAASDGGTLPHHAAFGWVLRDHLNPLSHCYGPVSGYKPTPYRAECFGLLSFVSFLHCILPQLPSSSSLSVHCDNKSLCHRIQLHTTRYYYSPSEAISPERDVISQIESVMDSLPLNLQIHHIKSHQDDTALLSTLSIPAQANCAADDLATRGLHECSPASLSPLFPAAQCQLVIQNATITSRHASVIRRLAYESHLRKHICTTQKWGHSHYVDWAVFETLCTRNTRSIRFFLKWIHRVLPVGKTLHRRNPAESPFCPACGQLETQEHLLYCRHTSRHLYYQKLMTTLRTSVDKLPTDPILIDILIDGVNSIFTSQSLQSQNRPNSEHCSDSPALLTELL